MMNNIKCNQLESMDDEFNKLLNESNKVRVKIYYQLKDLEVITGLSKRSLLYRMKSVKEKYTGVDELLIKKGRSWKIHYTIIEEFMPKYKKATNVFNYGWKSFITWNLKDSYDLDYHKYLITEIRNLIPNSIFIFTIEKDARGVHHLHALTDINVSYISKCVNSTLNRYLSKFDYKALITEVNNKYNAITYLQKQAELHII